MKNKKIYVKVGIYDAQYELREHKDGRVTVKVPYVKWVGNNGSLSHEIVIVDQLFVNKVKSFFESGELCNDSGESLDDYLGV